MKLRREGAEIHYEVFGKGPAVIFAHGLGGNHLSWWQQVAHFAPNHTCVVFAHRGFPPSSPVSGKTAPDSYADDLAALIKELKLSEITLVAQSMGGWTCLDYTMREPKKVRALVMASTSGVLDFSQLKNTEVDEWSRQSPGKLKDMQSRGIHPAGGERMAKEQPALAQLYRYLHQLTPGEFKNAVRARIRKLRDQPPSVLAKYARNGKSILVPKAGHSVYFERAPQFNRDIEEFLRGSA